MIDETDGPDVKLKVKPKSLGCAVRGVYASLWNLRAVAERSFARIDQSSVAMGLAIVPAYDTESDVAANAVVVTRVLNTDAVYGYSLSIQQGNNLVTNPDPGTFSETMIAGFISDQEPLSFTVTRYAKPTKDGPVLTAQVLSRDQILQIVEISKAVERAYCAAKGDYYGGDCRWVTADNAKPKALDLELKVLENGELVVKQVREFGGREAADSSATFPVTCGETGVWNADSAHVCPHVTGNVDPEPLTRGVVLPKLVRNVPARVTMQICWVGARAMRQRHLDRGGLGRREADRWLNQPSWSSTMTGWCWPRSSAT